MIRRTALEQNSAVRSEVFSLAQKLLTFLLLPVALAALLTIPVEAQTTATTTTFVIAGQGGTHLLQAGDGNFYATTPPVFQTCANDPAKNLCAYIFQVTQKGQAGIFYPFQPTATALTPNLDGTKVTSLFVGADGNLYGSCANAGPGGSGTIFQLSILGKSAGTLKVLKSFSASDPGSLPTAMILGADGNFYFTNGIGIYRLSSDGTVSPVYEYSPDPVKGTYPMGNTANSLVQGSDGNLYITQSLGPQTVPGTGKYGAIAQLTLSGQLTILHAFAEDGSEGTNPAGPLVQLADASLYGVTLYSGTVQGTAVAFERPSGGGFTVLHKFNGTNEGNYPNAPLILGSDGNFYGTTQLGGDMDSANCNAVGCGTFFQMTPSGLLTTLHNFEGGLATSTVIADNPQVDGEYPESTPVQTGGGLFYGITNGGKTGSPTMFQSSLSPAIKSPITMNFNPPQIAKGETSTLTWSVKNAFSLTAQQCVATIVGNSTAAGDWSGLQPGKLINNIFSGGVDITPTSAGTFTYALTCGGNESQFATLVVIGNSDLHIDTLKLFNGTVSKPYTGVLSASGGTPKYSWVIAGKQPKGINFDTSSGLLTGTPLQFGDYSLTFGVQDSSVPPETKSASFTLTIDSGLVLFASLPNPVVKVAYSRPLVVNGGLPPYTFSLDSGTLPTGLKFNATAGVISGTPTEVGDYTFTITVSDSEDRKATDTETFTLSTNPAKLSILTDSLLPAAKVAVPYSTSFTASGGTPPYRWTYSPQTQNYLSTPPGITLTSGGVLSGTPVQFKFYSFSVTLSDSAEPPNMVSSVFGLSVEATLKITTTSLPNGTVGTRMIVPLTATGGIPPYTWKPLAANSDDIGLFFDGANNLIYIPLKPATASVRLVVQDSETNPDSDSIDLPLTFLPAPLVTTTKLTTSNPTAGTAQSITLTAKVTASGTAAPAGPIIFYNGTASIGTANLDATGTATLQTSFSATGVYTLVAAYGGNPSYAASTSAPVTETVVTPTVSASVSPGSITIAPGKSGQLVITITPTGAYTGTVNFSCGTLPPHVSCTFAPPSLTIAAGSGPVTDTLTVSTNAPQMAMLQKPADTGLFASSTLWFPGSLVGMLGLIGLRRRSTTRHPRNLWMVGTLCFASACIFAGCATSTNDAHPGTYTIPVSLTLKGGASQTVNATVIVE